MFGINKLIIKVVLIIVCGIVLICIGTTAGCGSANGALAMKTSTETESADNSIEFAEGGVLYDPVEVIGARAEERVRLVRAEEEKWRLAVWIFGIGTVVVAGLALLVRSPLDMRGIVVDKG